MTSLAVPSVSLALPMTANESPTSSTTTTTTTTTPRNCSVSGVPFSPRITTENNGGNAKPAALNKSSTTRVRSALQKMTLTQPEVILPVKLCKMAARGDVDGLRQLLENPSTPTNVVNLCDYDSRHPLNLAAEEGHLEAVKFLVEHGADVNCCDRWGMTPLAGACLFNRTDIVDFLRNVGGLVGDDVFSGLAEKLHEERVRRRIRATFVQIQGADATSVARETFEAFIQKRFGLDPRFHKIVHAELDAVSKTETVASSPGDDSAKEKEVNAIHWTTFSKFCESNPTAILARAFEGNLVLPDWKAFTKLIKEVFDEVRNELHRNFEIARMNYPVLFCRQVQRDIPPTSGHNASYIPELADVPSTDFAACVVSVDGQMLSIGAASDAHFSIQSCMKPILYAFNLQHLGSDYVHKYVGREPSGAAFNAFTLNADMKPHNSCINSGAIMNSALYYPELSLSKRFRLFSDSLKSVAGGVRPTFSQSVYLSEKACAFNNMALAFFLKANNAFPEKADFVEAVDFYFQLCSIEVDVQLLASVAATFAKNGRSPLSGEKIFDESVVKANLQLMYLSGMYDFSGEWACTVGLPAKSGVCGAIYFVVPNLFGMCVYAPPLDAIGNSVRAVEFCKRLKRRMPLAIMDVVFRQPDDKNPMRA